MTLTPSTHVMREDGHDVAVCEKCYDDFHPLETGYKRRQQLQEEK